MTQTIAERVQRYTHEDLRKWGAELDREMPRSIGERLLCFADDWRVCVEAHKTTPETNEQNAVALEQCREALEHTIATTHPRATCICVRCEDARATFAALSALPTEPAQAEGWISGNHLPPSGVKVLAAYRNKAGKWRRICAHWITAKTVESDVDSDIGIYDKATDTYYDAEGWYERIENWDDFTYVVVYEDVSHWRFLPDPPADPQGEK